MKIKAVEFTQYIAPDGNLYRFDSTDRFLMSEDGFGLPPIDYITQKGPQQHGETLIDFRLGVRTIQLQLRQDSNSRDEYWDRRALLINSIRPNRFVGDEFGPGVLRRIFGDGTIKDIHAIIQEGPGFVAKQVGKWDEWGFTETLRFVCHDPIFFNPIMKSVSFSDISDAGGDAEWVLPFSFPIWFGATAYSLTKSIIYPGTWLSYPTITLTGPMNGPVINNTTTGEKLAFNYNISSGEIVTVSLEPGNKSVTNDAGADLIGVLTGDSDTSTFHVAPDPEVAGGINTFSLQLSGSSALSSVVIAYYERYIGL